MNLIVVGTSYKYSPIALREKLSFSKRRLKDALLFLRERGVLGGAIILSTCNRVEIYASAEHTALGVRAIEDFISRYYEIDKRDFSSYLYIYEDKEAIRHLFSVACGLDSLVLGETQILGQVKFSFYEAASIGFTDRLLKQAFYCAMSFARRVHAQTKISEGKVSVGSVAMDFIKEKLGGSLLGKNILIIGVGKVTEIVLRYLKKEDPSVVFISNRSFKKAKELACQIGARVVRFEELKEFLKKADVIITATASPHFIIKRETLKGSIAHKILIVDLALPRDVDPEVGEIKNVDLFCLEDLDSVIKKNVERKTQEAKKVRAILDIEVKKIWSRMQNYEEEFLRDPEVLLKR